MLYFFIVEEVFLMNDHIVVLDSDTINKYTGASSGFTSLSILGCLCLAGVCFFLFAGQVDSSKMMFAYCSALKEI